MSNKKIARGLNTLFVSENLSARVSSVASHITAPPDILYKEADLKVTFFVTFSRPKELMIQVDLGFHTEFELPLYSDIQYLVEDIYMNLREELLIQSLKKLEE
jgi:hypothetical protein